LPCALLRGLLRFLQDGLFLLASGFRHDRSFANFLGLRDLPCFRFFLCGTAFRFDRVLDTLARFFTSLRTGC
jgi:hypothetical protein